MKNRTPLYPILALILALLIAFYSVANVVNSDTPYIESMDLVQPYNAYQRKWMNEAWEMTHDKEFMYMLKAENGMLNHDRRHDPSANKVGVDWGFCGTNDVHNAVIRNDPRFMTDPLWQLQECYKMFKGGTTFYAYNRTLREPEYRRLIQSHFMFF